MRWIALAALAFPSPASALVCAPHAALVAHITERFGEARIGIGIDGGGGLTELFVAPDGKWTVLRTMPGGQTCAVAARSSWERVDEIPDGEGA